MVVTWLGREESQDEIKMGAQDGQWLPEPVKCRLKLEARGEVEGRRLLQAKGVQALGSEGLGFGPGSIPFFCWSWAGDWACGASVSSPVPWG